MILKNVVKTNNITSSQLFKSENVRINGNRTKTNKSSEGCPHIITICTSLLLSYLQ